MAGTNPQIIVSYIGYTKTDCYFKFYPHDGVKELDVDIGTEVTVLNHEIINGYSKVIISNEICWIKTKYITKKKPYTEYKVYDVGTKAYMDWECINVTSSPQYQLQMQSYTDYKTGIRMVGNRYCIAIGQYYTNIVGTKIDLIVQHPDKSKSKIKCILGDCKANVDTDITNMYALDGSVSEFIVNTSSLPQQAKIMGDLSYINKDFNGIIIKVIVYKEN